MKTGKAILAVLAGVATGAALGVLFASDKGSVTRKRLSKEAEDLADALDEKIDEKFDELLTTVTGKVKMQQNSSAANKKNEMAG